MRKQVRLTIDDRQITAPAGTLIVNAAKQIGIDIPVFCYHPKMEPVGMCRMCLVEVGRPIIDRNTGQPVLEDGQPKIQFGPKLETACTTPVSEGMVVRGMSEKAKAGQNEIVEFLLTSHPLDCPICDKGGECPLQNLTMEHGPGKSRFLYDEKFHLEKRVPLGDLIFLDRERCIQCARCIRFQDEIAGEPVIGFYNRGRATDIVTYTDPGFDSVFSGNTTDICPVGALTTSDFRFGARTWELKSTASVCGQCPVGCNIVFNTRREAKADGRIVIKRVMPRQNEQVNEIWLCDKGRFAYHYTENGARLSRPLVKKNGKLEASSWDEAAAIAGGKLRSADGEVVVLASGRLSNEDLFNLKSLADGLGGKALLYTQMGGGDLTARFGVGAGTNFGEMGAGTTILVAASDLYNEAPVWHLRVKGAAKRGATVIVANGRETKLDAFAKYVVRYAYGDEVETINGLQQKEKIGEAITSAENLVVLFGSDGLGLNGTSNLAAACAELVQGRAGKPNNGLIGVWPKANDQGAWEIGFRPTDDLSSELKGKTVYVVAADPAGDDPQLAAALKEAKFVIAQELFQTATADLADVVLPAQAYTERDGSFTSGERRAQRFYAAVPAFGESQADYAITALVADAAGVELADSAGQVFENLVVTVEAFAGLTYEILAETAEQWPVVGRGDMYYGGTTYENTRGLGAHLVGWGERGETASRPRVQEETELRPKEGQWLAVPVTKLYDQGLTVRSSKLLESHIGAATVTLHPEAAKRLGAGAGELVEISLNGTTAQVSVLLDETVSASVALLPRGMGLPISGPVVAGLKKV